MQFLSIFEFPVGLMVLVMKIVGPILYIGGTIWVYIDTQRLWKRSEKKEGQKLIVWLFLCLVFFGFAFPIYWILRKPRNIWKSISIIIIFWIIPILILALESFFSMQRRALQVELRGLTDSYISIGMSKQEVQYYFSEAMMQEVPLATDSIQFAIDIKEPMRAYILTYQAGNDVILLTFDANVDTLIYIKWFSELESDYGNDGERERKGQ